MRMHCVENVQLNPLKSCLCFKPRKLLAGSENMIIMVCVLIQRGALGIAWLMLVFLVNAGKELDESSIDDAGWESYISSGGFHLRSLRL